MLFRSNYQESAEKCRNSVLSTVISASHTPQIAGFLDEAEWNTAQNGFPSYQRSWLGGYQDGSSNSDQWKWPEGATPGQPVCFMNCSPDPDLYNNFRQNEPNGNNEKVVQTYGDGTWNDAGEDENANPQGEPYQDYSFWCQIRLFV